MKRTIIVLSILMLPALAFCGSKNTYTPKVVKVVVTAVVPAGTLTNAKSTLPVATAKKINKQHKLFGG